MLCNEELDILPICVKPLLILLIPSKCPWKGKFELPLGSPIVLMVQKSGGNQSGFVGDPHYITGFFIHPSWWSPDFWSINNGCLIIPFWLKTPGFEGYFDLPWFKKSIQICQLAPFEHRHFCWVAKGFRQKFAEKMTIPSAISKALGDMQVCRYKKGRFIWRDVGDLWIPLKPFFGDLWK